MKLQRGVGRTQRIITTFPIGWSPHHAVGEGFVPTRQLHALIVGSLREEAVADRVADQVGISITLAGWHIKPRHPSSYQLRLDWSIYSGVVVGLSQGMHLGGVLPKEIGARTNGLLSPASTLQSVRLLVSQIHAAIIFKRPHATTLDFCNLKEIMDFSDLPKDYMRSSLKFTRTVYQDVYPSIEPTNPELSLAGKVAIITGASRGIGARGFAPAFAKAGIKGLVLLARNVEALKAVETQIREVNSAVDIISIGTNIADSKAVEVAFDKIKTVFGHADILINNAGINDDGGGALIGDQDPDTWWSNFEINGKGTFLMTRSFIRQLPSTDAAVTIINITSAGAWSIVPPQSAYCLSKLLALQQVPFIAEAYPNITAIALHPGLVDTDMLPPAFKYFDLDTPELVGGFGVWLSHAHAKFLSGRFVAAQWSVDELLQRKDEILNGRQLKVTVTGPFGPKQFE